MNIEQIRKALRAANAERERVRALESLASIMSRHTEREPHVSITPGGRIRAWFSRADKEKGEPPVRDFVLTGEERIALVDWLKDTAWQRNQAAERIEAEIVQKTQGETR